MDCLQHVANFIMADLHNVSLKEAWHNDKFVGFRRMHIKGEIKSGLCYDCLRSRARMKDIISSKNYEKDITRSNI